MNRLFVYGIFLNRVTREKYGLSEGYYAVVRGYKTVEIGFGIVEAVPDPEGALTGLYVAVEPNAWNTLDRIEAGYDRIKVRTTDREECWMYVAKDNGGQEK